MTQIKGRWVTTQPTALDGRWTTTVADAYAAAHGATPGRPVEAVVVRDGKELKMQVKPVAGI